MALTKSATVIWNAQTLTAGAADTTSSAVDVRDTYGCMLHVKLTNGAVGPTVAAQVKAQLSADNSEWYDYGSVLGGSTGNSDLRSWSLEIPIGAMYLRLVAGSNTGQNVTVDADISEVTAL